MTPKKLAPDPAEDQIEEVHVAPAVAMVERETRRAVVVLRGLKHEIRVEFTDPTARHDPRTPERAVDLLAEILGSTPTDDPVALTRTEGKMALTVRPLGDA